MDPVASRQRQEMSSLGGLGQSGPSYRMLSHSVLTGSPGLAVTGCDHTAHWGSLHSEEHIHLRVASPVSPAPGRRISFSARYDIALLDSCQSQGEQVTKSRGLMEDDVHAPFWCDNDHYCAVATVSRGDRGDRPPLVRRPWSTIDGRARMGLQAGLRISRGSRGQGAIAISDAASRGLQRDPIALIYPYTPWPRPDNRPGTSA